MNINNCKAQLTTPTKWRSNRNKNEKWRLQCEPRIGKVFSEGRLELTFDADSKLPWETSSKIAFRVTEKRIVNAKFGTKINRPNKTVKKEPDNSQKVT